MLDMLLLGSVVILSCILCSRFSSRAGVPILLAFMVLGMLFGSDGILKISFSNYAFAEEVCTITLIIIMFYGGFGTNWTAAKPVAKKAVALSSLGVVITAAITGFFCYYVLHFSFLEGMLMGAVISSTDAASVFSILRSKKLNLKEGTASLLEVESGSNDPFAYMLTILLLTFMTGGGDFGLMLKMLLSQLFFAVLFGILIAISALAILKRFRFSVDGFDAAFVIAIAFLSYALPTHFGGNGFLSAYIVGIIMGNRPIAHKARLVHFFDGITGLMQMTLFFLLGLLATPSQIPAIFLTSICIALFLTFVARPISIFAILAPARCSIRQQLLVAWSGLRGAASIVFAMIAVVDEAYVHSDIFHITFCIVLLSIAFQGTLLPLAAKKLEMIDENADVFKTFNDYQEEREMQFIKLVIFPDHPWIRQTPRDLPLPPDSLLVMIIRNNRTIIPKGNTIILEGDTVVLSAPAFHDRLNIQLHELTVTEGHPWQGRLLHEIDLEPGTLMIMIRRAQSIVVPNGNTRLQKNDVCVLNHITP